MWRIEAIYERPRDYDLEHEGDDEDVGIYLRLLARWRRLPGRDDQGAARFGARLAIRVRHCRIEVDRIASLEHMLLVADVDMQRP
jgi:hypothetical protein